MAKVKQIKSMQERLAEAIVPKEQAPFAIPENWCWVRIGCLSNLYTGNSINEKIKADKYTGIEKGRPYISTKDISFDSVIDYNTGVKIPYDEKKFKVAPSQSVLLCIEGGSAGRKIGFLQQDVCFVNKLCCFNFYTCNDRHYGYYFFQSSEFYKLFNTRKVGLIGGVSVNNLKDMPFPLAPIAEQKRIVEKIESLFSRLDEAKELIQKSLDEFEDRKSAIFHKTLNGEFIRFQSNKTVKISEVAKVNPKTVKVICNDDDMVSFVPMRAVSEISGAVQENMYEKYGKVKKGFTYFEQGDVLFAKITPCMENGKCFIAQNLKDGFGFASTEFYVFKCSENIYNKYLWYILRDRGFRSNAAQVMTGAVGQQRVPKCYLENYSILLPSIEEQQEIVRILDNYLGKEDKSKELLDMIDRIEEMKKSILARAFRGELGTHCDDDEPAIGFLKKII